MYIHRHENLYINAYIYKFIYTYICIYRMIGARVGGGSGLNSICIVFLLNVFFIVNSSAGGVNLMTDRNGMV